MQTEIAHRTFRKLSARILPFLFILYMVAYLDRANIAFAGLTMVAELRFSEAVFGVGAGMFYAGYVIFEIPGALAVERRSARRWLSRILLTWGACAILLALTRTPREFIAARFLLGAAEAGFFPGMIVYLARWFPRQYRGRALAGFIVAIPLSLLAGAPISAALLGVHWFGYSGWRWVLLLEGLPAILLGIVTPFYLTNRPSEAQWLAPEEREWLEAELAEERRAKQVHSSVWSAIRRPDVLCFAAALFLTNVAAVSFLIWMPRMIAAGSQLGPRASSAVAALPFLMATAAVAVAGRASDVRGNCRLHAVFPMLAAAASFGILSVVRKPFPALLALLCLTCAMLFAWAPAFWSLPTRNLGEAAAAAAIAFINSVGNLGGFAGPSVAGVMLSHGRTIASVMALAAVCMSGAALLVLLADRVPADRRS